MDEDRLQPKTIVFVVLVLAVVVGLQILLNVDDTEGPTGGGNALLAPENSPDAIYPVDLHHRVESAVQNLADSDAEVRLAASVALAEILRDPEKHKRLMDVDPDLRARMEQTLSLKQADPDLRVREQCGRALSLYASGPEQSPDELP